MDCTVVGDTFFDIMVRSDPFKFGLVRARRLVTDGAEFIEAISADS